MAPIRRYLRITKYSVLEVRIYLEKPSDAPWLLRDQVLTRIFKEIQPKVLPKLREENENSKKKGSKKKKGIKDVVSQDDFEVVLFITDSTTRHSLITKQKQFSNKPAIKSTGTKLTGWLNNTSETAILVEDGSGVLMREDSDEGPKLSDIPELPASNTRQSTAGDAAEDAHIIESSEEDAFQTQKNIPSRRRRQTKAAVESDDEADDKKKQALNTSYDGFSLYGKILCLIVKRKGQKKSAVTEPSLVGGSQMMESWVSTQVQQQPDLDDMNG